MTHTPHPHICLMCKRTLEIDRPGGIPYCTHCDRGHEHGPAGMCGWCINARYWSGHKEAA